MIRIRTASLLFPILALSATATAQETLHALTGDVYHNHFGWSVAGLGDVDGDGLGDVAVGAMLAFPRVHVFSGASGVELYQLALPEPQFGVGVAGPGDLDGDGRGDVLVRSLASGSRVHAFSGATGSLLYSVTPATTVVSLAAIGDWNQDGVPDFAAGGGGAVHVFSGANGAVLFTKSHPGGSALAAADVDLDLQLDLIVAEPFFDLLLDEGKVEVLSGATGGVIHTWIGASQGARLGVGVAALDDLNGDGAPEILLGAPNAGAGAGHIEVRSGATGAILRSVEGTVTSNLGQTAAAIGDVDGDGFQDYAAGAPNELVGGARVGAVHVYSGDQNGVKLLSASDGGDGAFFGASLAAAGDINGNGLADVVAGAYHGEIVNGTSTEIAGAAFLIAGTCGKITNFQGTSCVGSGGFPPNLQAFGCATPDTVLTLSFSQILGGAPGLLLVGANGVTPLPSGCTLFLSSIVPIPVPIFASGASGSPGVGLASVAIEIPTGLPAVDLFLTGVFKDPGGKGGIAVTNRVRIQSK